MFRTPFWKPSPVRLRASTAILLSIIPAACDFPTGACPASASRAIGAHILDAQTGLRIAGGAVVDWTRDGVKEGSTHVPSSAEFDTLAVWVGDKTGSYDITITKLSYRTETRHIDVTSTGGSCPSVKTVPVDVGLTKS